SGDARGIDRACARCGRSHSCHVGQSRLWRASLYPGGRRKDFPPEDDDRRPPDRSRGRRRYYGRNGSARDPGRRECPGRGLCRVQGRRADLPREYLGDPQRRRDGARRSRVIPRYSRPEMAAIWAPENRYRIWFEIEAHAAEAMAELGIIPKDAARVIRQKGQNATFDVARIEEIEAETKHDVIAFLTHLAEIVGPEARFVHQGMTSSDVLDTCLNVQ